MSVLGNAGRLLATILTLLFLGGLAGVAWGTPDSWGVVIFGSPGAAYFAWQFYAGYREGQPAEPERATAE